ncbi:hypothetical protein SLA2020_361000 [Shorea laevis]
MARLQNAPDCSRVRQCIDLDCSCAHMHVMTVPLCHDLGIDTSAGEACLLSVPHHIRALAYMGVVAVTPCYNLNTSNLRA